MQKHYLWLGWLLSIIDRVTGYALGDFSKALHLAKMNSHASAWNPALMIKRSVMYFEGLIGASQICVRWYCGVYQNICVKTLCKMFKNL